VTCSLDIRHADDAVRDVNAKAVMAYAAAAADARDVTLAVRKTSTVSSISMNPALMASLAAAVESAGHQPHRMNSGAGHDAMILAPHVPAAMLFLRTPAGLSHHPDEAVLMEDVEAALRTCMAFVEALRT
jgi:allantoate deiminase